MRTCILGGTLSDPGSLLEGGGARLLAALLREVSAGAVWRKAHRLLDPSTEASSVIKKKKGYSETCKE